MLICRSIWLGEFTVGDNSNGWMFHPSSIRYRKDLASSAATEFCVGDKLWIGNFVKVDPSAQRNPDSGLGG
jgi:hypothetical protein